jgi:hypothetical protein
MRPLYSKRNLSRERYRSNMNKFNAAMLVIALAAIPIGAMAAEPPAPCNSMVISRGFNGPPPDMAQMQAQIHQLTVGMRTAMLQSLSAQHRAMLAQTIGNLAISVDPDYDAAAKAIDAALSAQEAQSVLRVTTQFHQQMGALMRAHMPPMPSMSQGESNASGQVRTQNRFYDNGTHQLDAGHALLMLGSSGPMEMHHVFIEKTVTH